LPPLAPSLKGVSAKPTGNVIKLRQKPSNIIERGVS
jgi:hypothetical protein